MGAGRTHRCPSRPSAWCRPRYREPSQLSVRPCSSVLVPGARGRACRPAVAYRSPRTSPMGWARKPVHLLVPCSADRKRPGDRVPKENGAEHRTRARGPRTRAAGASSRLPGPITSIRESEIPAALNEQPIQDGTSSAPPKIGGRFTGPRSPQNKRGPASREGSGPSSRHLVILVTRPAPTVRPPSRIAKRRPSSIAMGWISWTDISVLSPGMTISVPSGRVTTPVTSVVRK
jgi:hypothetical protein